MQERLKQLQSSLQGLIDISTEQKKKWEQSLKFLFKQLERTREVEELMENPPLLRAYLILSSWRYQTKEGMNLETILTKLEKETEKINEELKKRGLIAYQKEEEREITRQISTESLTQELQQRRGYDLKEKLTIFFKPEEEVIKEFRQKHQL